VPGSFPFPGGYVLISLLLINLIAAHSMRFKLRWKQTGIIVTHAGLILLLGSELVTAAVRTEGNMNIKEGTYSNYVFRVRDFELAVIDPSAEDHNKTTVIPDGVLLDHLRNQKGPISHPDLPFDVKIHSWMENSRLVRASAAPERKVRATAGAAYQQPPGQPGREAIAARPAPPVTGTDADQEVNVPSAYVTFTEGQNELGTYLVSPEVTQRFGMQSVEVDGKAYQIGLRFERHYVRSEPDAEPIQMHLIDFKHEKFTGTETPRAFKSEIRLVDPARNVDRKVVIEMNEPLFYAGKTFYQSGFMPDNSGTVLQVVDNPTKTAKYLSLPYIACGLIGVGLLIHFGMNLFTFLRRRF
jgi:cytochrome c biogenesis protein ResB